MTPNNMSNDEMFLLFIGASLGGCITLIMGVGFLDNKVETIDKYKQCLESGAVEDYCYKQITE